MARLKKKCRRQVPQVVPINRHSLRDGLHAYTQSPWCAGLLATIRDNACAPPRDTSIGVSGPCDFTSASCRSSAHSKEHAATSRGHRLPASRVVTIARNAPLLEAGWGERNTISEK